MAVERFGGVEELREMQLDAPLMGPDYVLIRIAAAGVNRVDTLIRSGGAGRFQALRVALDRTYPLAEAGAAQSWLAAGGVRGKIALEV